MKVWLPNLHQCKTYYSSERNDEGRWKAQTALATSSVIRWCNAYRDIGSYPRGRLSRSTKA